MTDLQMRIGHRISPSKHQVEPKFSHKQWTRPGYTSPGPNLKKQRHLNSNTSHSSPVDPDAEPSLLSRMNLDSSSSSGNSRNQDYQTKSLAERISGNVVNTTPGAVVLGSHVIESSGDYKDTVLHSSNDNRDKEFEVIQAQIENKGRLDEEGILSLSTSTQELKHDPIQEQVQTQTDAGCEDSRGLHVSTHNNATTFQPSLRSEGETTKTQTPFKSQLATLIIQNSQLRRKHEALDGSKHMGHESIDSKAIDDALGPDICASITSLALLAGKQCANIKSSEADTNIAEQHAITRNKSLTPNPTNIVSTYSTVTYKQPIASSSRQTLPDIANNHIRVTTGNESLKNTSSETGNKVALLSTHSPTSVRSPLPIPIPITTMPKPRDVSPPLTVSQSDSYSSYSSSKHNRRPSRDYDHDGRMRGHGRHSSEDTSRDYGRRSSYSSRSSMSPYSQQYQRERRSSTEYRPSYYLPCDERYSRSPDSRRIERHRPPSPRHFERNGYHRSRSPPRRRRTPPLDSPPTLSRPPPEHQPGVEENRTSLRRRTPTSPRGRRKEPYSPTDVRVRHHQQEQSPERGDVNDFIKNKIESDALPRPRARTPSINASRPAMVYEPSPVNAEAHHHNKREAKTAETAARVVADSDHLKPPFITLLTSEKMQVSTDASTTTIPDVWYFTSGSKSSTTHEHVFEVDKEKATRWRIPLLEDKNVPFDQSPKYQGRNKGKIIEPEISLRLICYPRDQFHAVHKSFGSTPWNMIKQLKKLQCKWPSIGKLLIQVNPDYPSGKTFHPKQLRDSNPYLELNTFIREGQNLVRLIQLGDISEYSFILYSIPSTQDKRPIPDTNVSHESQVIREIRDLVATQSEELLRSGIVAKITILDVDDAMDWTVG